MAEDSRDAAQAYVSLEQLRATARRQADQSDQRVGEQWAAARAAVATIGPSPTDVQVCFLEGLMSHPDEARRFFDDPGQYAMDHGVLLDPDFVRTLVAVVAFGEGASRLEDRLSPGALREVVEFRDRAHAGVLQGAASAAAAATGPVMTAAEHPHDLLRIKGLGREGVRLPGGRTLRLPADLRADAVITASNNAVAMYAATTVAATAGRPRLSDIKITG